MEDCCPKSHIFHFISSHCRASGALIRYSEVFIVVVPNAREIPLFSSLYLGTINVSVYSGDLGRITFVAIFQRYFKGFFPLPFSVRYDLVGLWLKSVCFPSIGDISSISRNKGILVSCEIKVRVGKVVRSRILRFGFVCFWMSWEFSFWMVDVYWMWFLVLSNELLDGFWRNAIIVKIASKT